MPPTPFRSTSTSQTHAEAIANYTPGDGWLILLTERKPGFLQPTQEELVPFAVSTELRALRIAYEYTQLGFHVLIHPDPRSHT